jgi:putative hydrolase of the HAD superfamily
LGLAERLDAAVFSSEVGYRKPHPAIYREALARLGVEPAAALFAGDRVLEDVVGPGSMGMATCLVTCWRSDEGDHALADHTAEELLDVVRITRSQM